MGNKRIFWLGVGAGAALAIAPSGAAAQSGQQCAGERGLYARWNMPRARIVIVNQADYPVRVFWINADGVRVPYTSLAPGRTFRSYSFASHAWVVTDMSGNCRQVFFTESDDRTYIFNAPRATPRYDPDQYDGPDTVEPLTERDADREIDVQIGQEMTIALPSNASTGYYWSAAFPTNVSVLGRVTEERRPNAMIGAGGTSLVRFRVLRPGPAEITLMYLPPGGGRARKSLVYRFRGI